MVDYFADRIPLNQAPDMTDNTTHGLKFSYIDTHEPNPGINSGMDFEIMAVPNMGKRQNATAELPSQNADTDFTPSGTVGNPMDR